MSSISPPQDHPELFTGLSAFPLTPLPDDRLDEQSFTGLINRLAAADVDTLGVLGSTGSYTYLSREERRRVIELAVDHAEGTPVMAGIGALRTSDVQVLAEDAQNAGAAAVLLAPVSYQQLNDDEVFGLFKDVTAELSVPLAIYDNPGTTRFTFTPELYGRIAELPHVAGIKIPPVPAEPAQAAERMASIRAEVPQHVRLGVSGDHVAATGMNAGCEAWYSAIAGVLPDTVAPLARAALHGDAREALRMSAELQPLWELFGQFGSLRVTAAVAEHLGLVAPHCLPAPVRGLGAEPRRRLVDILGELPEVRHA